jgi:hypothetical protein
VGAGQEGKAPVTDAELEQLCKRHGIPFDEGQRVLKRVLSQLEPPPPRGIGLKPEHLGSVMEAAAHLNDIMNDAPYEDGNYWAMGEAVIRFIRKGDLQ